MAERRTKDGVHPVVDSQWLFRWLYHAPINLQITALLHNLREGLALVICPGAVPLTALVVRRSDHVLNRGVVAYFHCPHPSCEQGADIPIIWPNIVPKSVRVVTYW